MSKKVTKLGLVGTMWLCSVAAVTNKTFFSYQPSLNHIFFSNTMLRNAADVEVMRFRADAKKFHDLVKPLYGATPVRSQHFEESYSLPEDLDYSLTNTFGGMVLVPERKDTRIIEKTIIRFEPMTIHEQHQTWLQDLERYGEKVRYPERMHYAPHLAISATGFFQTSCNENALKRYFSINNKHELVIKGATAAGACDISGSWLQILGKNGIRNPGRVMFAHADHAALYFNEYSSKITFFPEYTSYGATVLLHKTFASASHRLWAMLELPFIHTQTNMNIREYDVQNAYGSYGHVPQFIAPAGTVTHPTTNFSLSALDAFNQSAWRHGKITNRLLKKEALADITATVGFHCVSTKKHNFDVYAKGIIPTTRPPENEYLFEPMVGNLGHAACGAGALGSWVFDGAGAWALNGGVDYIYLFSSTENRSFDLKNGPWSRYLLVHDRRRVSNTLEPGINYFSRTISVTPGHKAHAQLGLSYEHSNIRYHVGYGFGYQHREKIAYKDNLEIDDLAIPFYNASAVGINNTFSTATIGRHINERGALDAAPISISQDLLDKRSAERSSVLAHAWHTQVEYQGAWKTLPLVIGIGGAYEYGNVNNTLRALTGWFTVQCSF